MAKQNRPIIWEVTIDFISFYKRCGVGCVRMKSNLTAERWRSDPAFEGSRHSAACMAMSSQLASSFYQTIPQQQRYYPHYKELVGIAQHMLCEGYNIKQVNKVLHFAIARYLRKLQAADPNRKPIRSPFAATCSLKAAALSLKSKPAFTTVMPHRLAVPRFAVVTVSTSTSSFTLWPAIMPPRGSPAVITRCTQQTGTGSATTCHLSGSTPVTTSHSQWQALLCPCLPISPVSFPKQHSKRQENVPEYNFQASNFLIAS